MVPCNTLSVVLFYFTYLVVVTKKSDGRVDAVLPTIVSFAIYVQKRMNSRRVSR